MCRAAFQVFGTKCFGHGRDVTLVFVVRRVRQRDYLGLQTRANPTHPGQIRQNQPLLTVFFGPVHHSHSRMDLLDPLSLPF